MSDKQYPVAIEMNDPRWEHLLPHYQDLCQMVCVWACKASASSAHGEISILLTNDQEIQHLNETYRNKDYPTNVLSFPNGSDFEPLLGDVILSVDTIQNEAYDQDKNFEDHMTHLLVHGVLHLLGYDHMTDEEADFMEATEIRILQAIGIANPYE